MTSTKSCGGSRSGPGKSEKIAWWARLGGPYNLVYIYIYIYTSVNIAAIRQLNVDQQYMDQ